MTGQLQLDFNSPAPDIVQQQDADDRDLDAELRRRIDQRAPGWQAAPHGLLLLARRRARRGGQR